MVYGTVFWFVGIVHAVDEVVGEVEIFDDAGERLRRARVLRERQPRRSRRRDGVDVVGEHQIA